MCEFCGYDPCKTTQGKLADIRELDAEDWKLVYDFMQFVQLPFVHSVIIRARKRKGLDPRSGRPVHGNRKIEVPAEG